jgi:hypothetical protein
VTLNPKITFTEDAWPDGFATVLSCLGDFTFDVSTTDDVFEGVMIEVDPNGLRAKVFSLDPLTDAPKNITFVDIASITEVRYL